MSFISKILGNKDEEFREVRVDREVLESVIYYSKKSYPNEFLAFFDGEIKDKVLYITGLIFLPGERSKTSAVIHTEMIPMNTPRTKCKAFRCRFKDLFKKRVLSHDCMPAIFS